MSSLRERNILYARLEEVLGTEPAGILMNQFPTDSGIATKFDLDALGDRVDLQIDRLDTRMDGFNGRMDRFEQRMDQFDGRMERFEIRMDRLDARMERFEDKLDGFHAALREQTRTYMLTMTGVMASFAAVVVATGILT